MAAICIKPHFQKVFSTAVPEANLEKTIKCYQGRFFVFSALPFSKGLVNIVFTAEKTASSKAIEIWKKVIMNVLFDVANEALNNLSEKEIEPDKLMRIQKKILKDDDGGIVSMVHEALKSKIEEFWTTEKELKWFEECKLTIHQRIVDSWKKRISVLKKPKEIFVITEQQKLLLSISKIISSQIKETKV